MSSHIRPSTTMQTLDPAGVSLEKKKKPLHEYPDVNIATELHAHIGVDSMRRNGLHTIDKDIVIAASGNLVLFINYQTGVITSLTGPTGGGVGAVTVHPSKNHFVVCEKAPENPRVVVYSYPEKKETHVMTKGAVVGFSTCAFNEAGNLLATVGIAPDFTLTIWDWKQEVTVLRNKAFSSDVYKVAFCPFNEGTLITSGMGHLKIWTMASTFTGLKLQGAIGKFGRVELSDVCGAVTFPSGKVLSGSEFGSLLLWEGNLVKYELRRLDNIGGSSAGNMNIGLNDDIPLRLCHDGNIEIVQFVEDNTIIMTSGDDGYVRYWDFAEMEMAKSDGVDLIVGIKCLKELWIGHEVKARSITLSKDKDHWVMLDASGSIRTFPYFRRTQIMVANSLSVRGAPQPSGQLLHFFSGGINTLSTSPVDHTAVAGGADGSLRLFDYVNSKEIYSTKFDSEVVCVKFFPSDIDSAGPGTHMFCGFGNGCVRLVKRCRDAFEVLGAWRPHDAKLCGISFDVTMTQMYTAADDNTAFYFKLSMQGLQVEPVGFCRLPSLVTCLEWTQEGDACLIGFENGEILALDPPHEEVDHSVGYEFMTHYAGIGYRQRKNPPPKEKVLLPTGEYDDNIFDEEEEEEADNGPWGVNFIHRLPPSVLEGKCDVEYVIGLQKEELSYKYKCNIRYTGMRGPPPIPPTGVDPPGRVEEPHGNVCYRDYVPISGATSPDKASFVLVCAQSRVIIHDISQMGISSGENKEPNLVYHAKQFHDGIDGKISAANLSYDGAFLITTGLQDGLIVVQLVNGKSLPVVTELNLEYLPIADALKKEPLSVENSIQQQKVIDDVKRINEMAEGQKSRMIRKINEVHLEYNKILSENDSAERGKKLTEEDITLDPELLRLLEIEKEKRVSEAAVDYSWQVAWKEKLLKQLRDAFVDNLTHDRFTIHSFGNKFSVSSLRAPAITSEHEDKVNHLEELMTHVNKNDIPTTDEERKLAIQQEVRGGNTASAHSNDSRKTKFDSTIGELADTKRSNQTTCKKSATQTQLDRAEERRIERLERKIGYENLLSHKPKPTDPDPIGEAAYRDTKENMGDFILKTAPEYRVSLNLVPTAERKAKELIVLEHSIHHLRVQFNEKLLQLRDLKRKLIIKLNKDRSRLEEILPSNEHTEIPPLFSLLREEEPEKRFDASRETLLKLAKERAKQQRRDKAARKDKGFGADLAQCEDDDTVSEEDVDITQMTINSHRGTIATDRRSFRTKHLSPSLAGTRMPARDSNAHALLTLKEKVEMELHHRLENVRLSELEEEEIMIQREMLDYEKNRILKHIHSTCDAFNDKLMAFCHEGLKLTADLCMADMRALLLYREFRMLINFQKKDNELSDKYAVKEIEQQENIDRTKELRSRVEEINTKQLSIGASMRRLSDEAENFIVNNFLPDDHRYLRRVFTRKIKRRKCIDEDDDDDDAPTSDDEDELEDEDFDECCPNTCDPEMWEMLLQLRERRLDYEEDDEEIKKNISTLTTSLKKLNERYEIVKTELNASSMAIDDFQIEKQHRLNLLETIVVLKLSQVQCLNKESRKLPPLYNNPEIIVFTEGGIKKLRNRIIQLAEDKRNLHKDSEVLSMDRLKLCRRKTKRQIEHNEWDQKVYDVQLLKFGQKVDLDALEGVAMNREIEELKEQLKLEEIKWGRELRKEDDKVGFLRHENQSRIGENTMLLKDLGNLRSKQHDLEAQVAQTAQKIVIKMSGGSKIATVAERARLKEILIAQQDQIDCYKVEVEMLRRKGGHLYTPIVQKQNFIHSSTAASDTIKIDNDKKNELRNQGFAASALDRHTTLLPRRPKGSAPVGLSYSNGNDTNTAIGEYVYQSEVEQRPYQGQSGNIDHNVNEEKREYIYDSTHHIDEIQHVAFMEPEEKNRIQDKGQPQDEETLDVVIDDPERDKIFTKDVQHKLSDEEHGVTSDLSNEHINEELIVSIDGEGLQKEEEQYGVTSDLSNEHINGESADALTDLQVDRG